MRPGPTKYLYAYGLGNKKMSPHQAYPVRNLQSCMGSSREVADRQVINIHVALTLLFDIPTLRCRENTNWHFSHLF